MAKGIEAVRTSVSEESGKDFMLDEKYGYLHSCPTNLGTGMRASVHIDLPGWTKEGLDALKKRCEELKLQPRGTRGESGGQTGVTYDISNKHRFVKHFFFLCSNDDGNANDVLSPNESCLCITD